MPTASKRRASGGGSKSELIKQALTSEHAVVDLRQLALSPGGLVAHRESAWNILLQLDVEPPAASLDGGGEEVAAKTLNQIGLDVARSYGNLPEEQGSEKRAELKRFLARYFAINPTLHYYQGFHDVAMVVLEVFPTLPSQLAAMRQISTNWVFY
ncbi:hypothetical protein BASA81_004724, partial [Batrachochytrium salamandrivorans]